MGQRGRVRQRGAQRADRQRIEQVIQRSFEAVFNAGAGQGEGGHTVGGPRRLATAESDGLLHDAITQRTLAPEQPDAPLDLQHHSVLEDGNAGRELQRPGGQCFEPGCIGGVSGWRGRFVGAAGRRRE